MPEQQKTAQSAGGSAFSGPRLALLVLLAAGFFLAYFPVWKRLVATWLSSEEYSHGFFIVPVCAYIVWKQRAALAQVPLRPSNLGLALTLFFLAAYLVADFAEILTLSSLSMVFFLAGAIAYLYGFPMLRALKFPLFLLLFMIPVPAQIQSELTIVLQLFVTKASVWVSALIGVPVYREGNVIHLPGHTLQVVQACSGLRSMFPLMALTAVFGYLSLKSNVLRAVLLVAAVPTSIVVNIVRVFVLIVAFYYYEVDLSAGGTHTLFGTVIFVLGVLILAAVKVVLDRFDKTKQSPDPKGEGQRLKEKG
jgi:exosortase